MQRFRNLGAESWRRMLLLCLRDAGAALSLSSGCEHNLESFVNGEQECGRQKKGVE